MSVYASSVGTSRRPFACHDQSRRRLATRRFRPRLSPWTSPSWMTLLNGKRLSPSWLVLISVFLVSACLCPTTPASSSRVLSAQPNAYDYVVLAGSAVGHLRAIARSRAPPTPPRQFLSPLKGAASNQPREVGVPLSGTGSRAWHCGCTIAYITSLGQLLSHASRSRPEAHIVTSNPHSKG